MPDVPLEVGDPLKSERFLQKGLETVGVSEFCIDWGLDSQVYEDSTTSHAVVDVVAQAAKKQRCTTIVAWPGTSFV